MQPDLAVPAQDGDTVGAVDDAAWTSVLDELARRLDGYRLALAGAGTFPEPFVLPAGLGPLPARLGARARMVATGQQEVEHQVRARMEILAVHLHAPVASDPVFLDTTA